MHWISFLILNKMVDLSKCYSKLLKLKVWKALTLRNVINLKAEDIYS